MVCVSDFCWSEELDELLDGELEPFDPEVEPLPAEPLVLLLEELLGLDDEAPPPDGLFCVSLLEDELEEGEEAGGVALEELEEPDGDDGVVAPLDEDELDGGVAGVLVLDDDEPVADLPPPPLSQAASRLTPSAMETATAMVDSFIRASVVGLT